MTVLAMSREESLKWLTLHDWTWEKRHKVFFEDFHECIFRIEIPRSFVSDEPDSKVINIKYADLYWGR